MSKHDLLSVADLPRKTIHVKAWKRDVHVQGLSLAGFRKVQRHSQQDELLGLAAVVAYSVVDDDGKLVFEESDIEAISNKSIEAIKQISDAAMEISGMNTEVDELKNG